MSSTTMMLAVGYILLIFGVGYAAHLIGLSTAWITVLVLLAVGMGILNAALLAKKQKSGMQSHSHQQTASAQPNAQAPAQNQAAPAQQGNAQPRNISVAVHD